VAGDPQRELERRLAARHLLQRPLTCAEHDRDTFRFIRRHEAELDRWFTQRLGYRLHVDADTARLFKTGVVAEHRPLRTASGRAFHQLEYVLLALVLASTAAGPAVISLRDLIDNVRSAGAEAEVPLTGDATERRAMVSVLRWMIDQGMASELHARVDTYANDEEADAVLKVRPDRIALLPLPTLVGAEDASTLLQRGERRSLTRQWLRGRLVEEPVVYREDLTDEEWGELRRRLGEEERILDEMFGLVLEARAEGVATVDPTGALADRRFPSGGTVGHAALLLLDKLRDLAANGSEGPARTFSMADVLERVSALAERYRRPWANDLVGAPDRLTRQVIDLLVELRLVRRCDPSGAGGPGPSEEQDHVRLLPGAARFWPLEPTPSTVSAPQEPLW
jgi:uncharacterized protein (TIGR02678 family)